LADARDKGSLLEKLMAEQKTRPTDKSVTEFLDRVPDEKKRQDGYEILALMQNVTGMPPVLWGDSIVGFGSYDYRYASGHEGDTFITGFSPRKQAITLYGLVFYNPDHPLLQKLGKFKLGKGCLYIKRLQDMDKTVLTQLIQEAVQAHS